MVVKPEASFKEFFREWCEVTTCAGIVDWHLSKTLHGKVFWAILILIGLFLTIWQTFSLFKGFATDNPFQTTLSVKSDPIPFPNVTLCNINRINRFSLGEFENDTDLLSYALIPANVNYFRKSNFSEQKNIILEKRWSEFMKTFNITDIKNMFQKVGMSCEDTFVECRWGFLPFKCCKIMAEVISTYGRCWTIQPSGDLQKPAVQTDPGVYYGLEIVLNPNLDGYVNNLVLNNFLDEGFFLDVGHIQQSYINNFKVLQPGTHSWIGMKATRQTVKLSDFPIFKQDCRKFQKFKYLTTGYSPSNCEEDCQAEIFLDLCNCTVLMPVWPQYNICSPLQMVQCIFNLFRSQSFMDRFATCKEGCLPSCDPYWEIQTTQTSTKFVGDRISESFQKIVAETSNNTQILKGENIDKAICLNVFFESLNFIEVQTEETNPIFVFIGNIGGQLSLWLGISLVTIVQAWYYVISCCCTKKQNENKVYKVKSTVNKFKR